MLIYKGLPLFYLFIYFFILSDINWNAEDYGFYALMRGHDKEILI